MGCTGSIDIQRTVLEPTENVAQIVFTVLTTYRKCTLTDILEARGNEIIVG